MNVTFVDTSVLCELIEVPGMHSRAAETREELRRREAAGERFVIPATAIIETGNHIEHANGDRRERRSGWSDWSAWLLPAPEGGWSTGSAGTPSS